MIVPFGSCTRSTRTVYQSSRARYSRVSTFQAPGSSSKLTALYAPSTSIRLRARMNTDRIIGGVSLPVLVFWRLGW